MWARGQKRCSQRDEMCGETETKCRSHQVFSPHLISHNLPDESFVKISFRFYFSFLNRIKSKRFNQQPKTDGEEAGTSAPSGQK